jgi:hypothetical protein
MVSVMDPCGHILIFYTRAAPFSFKYLLNCTHKAEWTVPDPLLLRKCGSALNRAQTSGSVAKNSDHWTTEVVFFACTVDSRLSTRGLTALRLNRGNVFLKKKFYFP